jgi:hypothetical protein
MAFSTFAHLAIEKEEDATTRNTRCCFATRPRGNEYAAGFVKKSVAGSGVAMSLGRYQDKQARRQSGLVLVLTSTFKSNMAARDSGDISIVI